MLVAGARPSQTAVDAGHYRRVLGHFPTGVVVVTALDGGRPVGLAVGSFCSLSLQPPLVLFCVGRDSTSWPAISAAGRCGVNVLSCDQQELCRSFARSGGDKFAGVAWTLSTRGVPLLEGAIAWLDCRIDSVSTAGDHFVVVAAVDSLDLVRDDFPLVFCRGGFGQFQAHEPRNG